MEQEKVNVAKFRKKPVVIEAITFDQLVEHGKQSGAPLTNGMPWSFSYGGHPITHENDECYLIPTLEGSMRFTRDDVLITGVKGEIYPCKSDVFAATYDAEGTARHTEPALQAELEMAINRHSRENESNTPDFILAKYMLACLEAFETASRSREAWYGKSLSI